MLTLEQVEGHDDPDVAETVLLGCYDCDNVECPTCQCPCHEERAALAEAIERALPVFDAFEGAARMVYGFSLARGIAAGSFPENR